METNVEKIVNKNKLRMSRVPTWAKEIFLARAEEEFDGDYGQCLAALLKESGEYNSLKALFFSGELKLDSVKEIVQDTNEKEIKFGTGKIKKGGKK